MPRFDPTEFSHLLTRLTPLELRQAEAMIVETLERAEAVLEIDARADAGGGLVPPLRWRQSDPVGSNSSRRGIRCGRSGGW